jgi:hypothetical protein
MYTTFYKRHKEVLRKIIGFLSEQVFDCWNVVPIFIVEDFVKFSIEYTDSTENETQHRHEAMAFIAGYFTAKDIMF